MITAIRLADEELTALGRGHGGAAAVSVLGEAALSRHLLLLRLVIDSWPGGAPRPDPALAVLARAQARDPATYASLLRTPLVGAWAARTLRAAGATVATDVPSYVDFGHLGAIAAAAAYRTGLDAELTAHVRDGAVAIPTVGRALVPLPEYTPVRVTVQDGRLACHGPGTTIRVPADPAMDTGIWQALRHLTAEHEGRRLELVLDDLDPYRGGHHVPPSDRISPADLARWRHLLGEAWKLLAQYLPERADEIAAGLCALVPLVPAGPGASRSATMRDSFGVFGLTTPANPVDFALTLVHEFQHSKLSALLDMLPLYDDSGDELFYAPWRMDPRPIGGLLQGVYAFVGVSDAWRALLSCPAVHDIALTEFARVREQVNCALAGLLGADRLTAAGRGFVAAMKSTVDRMMTEPLPDDAVRYAREALMDNHRAWHARQAGGG
jgi:HEXXH motif-containing protein